MQNKLLMDFLWTCYGSLEGFSYGLLMQLRLSKKSYPLLGGPTQLDNQTCIGKSVDFQPSNLVHGKLAFFFDLQPFGVGEATWKRRLAKRSLESFEAARGLALLRFFWPRKNGCPEVFRWRGWDERPSWWSTWTRLFLGGGVQSHMISQRDILKIILQVYNLIYQTYQKKHVDIFCIPGHLWRKATWNGGLEDRGIHTTLRLWLDFGAATWTAAAPASPSISLVHTPQVIENVVFCLLQAWHHVLWFPCKRSLRVLQCLAHPTILRIAALKSLLPTVSIVWSWFHWDFQEVPSDHREIVVWVGFGCVFVKNVGKKSRNKIQESIQCTLDSKYFGRKPNKKIGLPNSFKHKLHIFLSRKSRCKQTPPLIAGTHQYPHLPGFKVQEKNGGFKNKKQTHPISNQGIPAIRIWRICPGRFRSKAWKLAWPLRLSPQPLESIHCVYACRTMPFWKVC